MLADALVGIENPLVIALPRGGVVVADPIARRLGAELDVLIVRKLGVPGHEEFGMGAIAEGGFETINTELATRLGISDTEIAGVRAKEVAELDRRCKMYRGEKARLAIEGRNVIVVDDGIATGGTVEVVLAAIVSERPNSITLAVPVAPPATLNRLGAICSAVVCPLTPARFSAVGEWYDRFDQTSDHEVCEILDSARRRD